MVVFYGSGGFNCMESCCGLLVYFLMSTGGYFGEKIFLVGIGVSFDYLVVYVFGID